MNAPNTKPTSILLADDDADDRMFFEDALKEIQIATELTCANDGLELMNNLDGVVDPPPPHVIFLDLNMPRKNGFDCLKEIRKTPNLKNIPVVIFSTTAAQDAVDETYRNGANCYICKPRSFSQLVKTIETVLSRDMWTEPRPERNKFVLTVD